MNSETQKSLLSAAGRYIRKLFGELEVRLKGVEELVAKLPDLVAREVESIRKPEDGKSVTVEDVQPLLAEMVKEAISQIPAAKNGEDGISVTVEDVMPTLKAHVDGLVAAMPVPKDGESVPVETVQRMVAEAVAGIEKPKDGVSVKAEEVLPELRELVHKLVADIPRPKNGEDGKSVDQDKVVESVLQALAPRIAQFLAEKDLEVERRLNVAIEKAIDRLPAPKNGRDAFEVDSFDVQLCEDGRTVTVSIGAGEAKRSKNITFPVLIYRGLYKEGESYDQGDSVTWGGSLWIAVKDDPTGKPGESDDWRLAVKKGRDAKGGTR